MRKLRLILVFLALAATIFYFSACLPWGSGGTNYGASPYGTAGSGGMMGGSGGMMGGGMMGGSGGMMGGQGTVQSFASNGERIYYAGVSASGRPIPKYGGPMWLSMHGGSCVSCHGEDGRGGAPVLMGSAIPPDISYYVLTGEHHIHGDGQSHQPYDDALIKRAIAKGIDAQGKTLDPTMPRWQMSDSDLLDLIEYLKSFPRPEMVASGVGPQSSDGHTHDSVVPGSAVDDHSHSGVTGAGHDSAASVPADGDHSHPASAEGTAGRPSYTFLISLLAVVAATFGTVFYVKRKGMPAPSASQLPPGPREMKQ